MVVPCSAIPSGSSSHCSPLVPLPHSQPRWHAWGRHDLQHPSVGHAQGLAAVQGGTPQPQSHLSLGWHCAGGLQEPALPRTELWCLFSADSGTLEDMAAQLKKEPGEMRQQQDGGKKVPSCPCPRGLEGGMPEGQGAAAPQPACQGHTGASLEMSLLATH